VQMTQGTTAALLMYQYNIYVMSALGTTAL
jgi:hypothetical protein